MVLGLSETSKLAPLTGSGTGLYILLFTECFPEQAAEAFEDFDRTVADYTRMYGHRMEADLAFLRRHTSRSWRSLSRKAEEAG